MADLPVVGGPVEPNPPGPTSKQAPRTENRHVDVESQSPVTGADLMTRSLASSRRAIYPTTGAAGGDNKEQKVIDLDGELSLEDRETIVRHALNTEQQDAEQMLANIRARFDRVEQDIPSVEVRFENLHVETSVYASTARNLPTILNSYRNVVESVLQKVVPCMRPAKQKLVILNNVSSILRPGRNTLMLGPPSAGKSTLLKALAGKLDPAGLQISGQITYNGHTLQEFLPQQTCVYVEQEDQHMPELTVRETCDFAARCQGVGQKPAELAELRKREAALGVGPDWNINAFMRVDAKEAQRHSLSTDLMLRMLGLDICADTIVGNQMIRGVSGGQKKRVTTAEMIVGPKKVYFLDEISTGLDSSTTFQIVKFLRDQAHHLKHTTLVALLQPAPETFELFDDILLLSDGYLVYHGPRENVMEFFESLGFKCPERKGIADFLQEVTSRKDQKQYWAAPGPYHYVSVAEFAEEFMHFHVGEGIREQLAAPVQKSEVGDRHHGGDKMLTRRRYSLHSWDLWKACLEREITLAKRNAFIYGFRFFVTCVMAFVTATLFSRTRLHPNGVEDGNVYFGVIFFSMINLLFDGFADETLTVQRLPGWYKQRDNYFYPAWAYVFPTTILRLPYSLFIALIWSAIVYYPVGLAPEASRFFTYLLLLVCVHSFGIAMFRALAAFFRDETITSTGGSFFFLILLLNSGFLLSRTDIPDWWIWAYWGNPVTYAQAAIAINEFKAPRWQNIRVPTGATVGDTILQQRGVNTNEWWIWLGVGALVFGWIVFSVLCWAFHAYLDPLDSVSPQLREEQEAGGEAGKDPASRKALSNKILGMSSKQLGNNNTNPANGHTNGEAIAEVEMAPTNGAPTNGAQPSSPRTSTSQRHLNLAELMERRTSGAGPGGATGTVSRKSLGGLSSQGSQELSQPQGGKGMVLPFLPLSLSFKGLNYYVDLPKELSTDPEKLGPRAADVNGKKMLQLLRECSGAFRPGILTALVGSSGAGKTTLMDVLAGRKTTGIIEGDVRVSGHPKVQATFARVMGYVEQNDIHSPHITVYESLVFSARLRFTKDVEQDIVYAFVEEVMELVELTPLSNAIVGLPGHSGLSVEQRKRLTIAVELVANPSIVFMDEPTSGLDARAAAIVMRTVRNTVNTGRTVVCTIHQPSIDIFEAFDDLLLMKSGGQIIYHGHLGKRSARLVEYFQAFPGVPRLAEGLNPATWMLQISTAGMESTIGVDFAKLYRESSLYEKNERLIERLSVPPEGMEPLTFTSKYPQNFLVQFAMIFWKFWMSYWRNPQYNATRFFFATFLALLVGSILWNVGGAYSSNDGTRDVQNIGNILGALYLAVLFLGIINSRTVQPVASHERSVMYRERAAGMYNELPFAVAQCIVEIPYNLVQTICFSAVAYFMMGFALTAAKFFWFVFIIFLTLNLMAFYGIMGVYITPDLIAGSVLSSFFYGFWNVFAGFIIPLSRMPPWWKWYYYINPIAWCLYGIIVTQLGDDESLVTFPGDSSPSVTVVEYLEDNFGYKYSFIGPVVGILIGFTVFFGGLAVLSLRMINYQRR
ncbi:hypothetical protein WJX72_009201 [[Myrmecia] bisecta]|uniref:ABC transporter domain-containing protein n=1 Tax=[Myrmecia] bisecta TaxID=41462 RepID=A0AAW1QGG7_9CHLO